MKFSEAMDKLKEGSKVTRKPWSGGLYFLMQEGDVKSFQPKLSPYIYNEDIMVSEGWTLDNEDGEFKFCDIIPYLQKGAKAKLKEWREAHIFLDPSSHELLLHSMEQFPYLPDFPSFVAEDWMVIE